MCNMAFMLRDMPLNGPKSLFPKNHYFRRFKSSVIICHKPLKRVEAGVTMF